MGVAATTRRELAGAGAHAAHLAQEVPFSVEDDDAMVAVAVRDVDAPSLTGDGIRVGVDGDVRRKVQQRMTAARLADVGARPGPAREVGSVAQKLGSDLEQQRLAVVRVLLDDAIVAVAADPHIALVVDEAAVDAVRQDGVATRVRTARHERRVAPGVGHAAILIELDNGGRGDRPGRAADSLGRRQAAGLKAAGHDEEVVAGIDAGASDLARHPVVGQRPGKERVDHESGDVGSGAISFRRDRLPQAPGDRQCCHHHGDVEIASALHDALLVRPVFAANSYGRIVGQDQSTEGYDRRGA